MVSSRLDYCNSILYDTSSFNLNKLQRVQNALACIVMMTRKRDHITPVLANLYWLPVTAYIQFKTDIQDTHDSSAKLHSKSHSYTRENRFNMLKNA